MLNVVNFLVFTALLPQFFSYLLILLLCVSPSRCWLLLVFCLACYWCAWCCNLCAHDHLQQCLLSTFSQFLVNSFLIFWILFCFVLLILLCCDVGFYFSLLGVLLLHLVLQLVHWWSFLTLFIVYFLAIFKELFPHFLGYVLLHVFCFVMMLTLFFFVNWHIVFAWVLWFLHWWSSPIVFIVSS